MDKKQRADLIIFLLWPIISMIISFAFKINNIASIILFLGVPCAYLTIRAKRHVIKSLYFALPISIIAMLSIDYIAQKSGSWEMYPNSILPFKFFGIVTFEVVLWAFLSIYFIVMFYEYFIHHEIIKRNWNFKMKYLMAGLHYLCLLSYSFMLQIQNFLKSAIFI